jgi:hypothetical protein
MLTRQPTAQRSHAHDLQAVYRKVGGGMAADLQGEYQDSNLDYANTSSPSNSSNS